MAPRPRVTIGGDGPHGPAEPAGECPTGIVFDVREFTVHDGPGIRATVFLKGCPLRCAWCHNPEGLSSLPQVMQSAAGRREVGDLYTADCLATILNRQAELLRSGEGGVTFSGGEPLMQAGFVQAVIERLDRVHTLLDTSGCGSEADMERLAAAVDLVYYDLKLIDPGEHERWTGLRNERILANLRVVSRSGTPFVVRVPLVPGVTDTDGNLRAIADTVRGLPGLVRVDLLPYNRAAGGKYAACGQVFRPDYDESRPVRTDVSPFEAAGLTAVVC